MPTIEPLTLTLAELAGRWNLSPQQVLESPHALPMYFYFDGLVFDFNDKWHRANGDASVLQTLEQHKTRLGTLEIDLQRQAMHKRGLLKLTQWEEALSDDELQSQQAEADRLTEEIAYLSAQLKQRAEERQRRVRNGLLRAAPRTLNDIAQRGQTRFPQFAYMPHTPNPPAGDQPAISEGAVVAMEDGFPLKETLDVADLVVAMLDVRSAEQRGAD
ncbi:MULTISPECIES: hypothetical protein [unclassified Duganella]|uniref:hypothetical protein n=1 Tax=unclassified Duganella TaxID=2636909 RepID=UPI00088DCCCC|nr:MULTISPECIES: hypothetical protein [unclassified Duganella]SDF92764.1 hypothetical protein SAMN05216320_10249 [Duganella sp. OV458]SDJ12215.1 hypothetical protein SAMN05428973_102502 [Duganella sp. OV510]